MLRGVLVDLDKRCREVHIQGTSEGLDHVRISDGLKFRPMERALNRKHFWHASDIAELIMMVTDKAFTLEDDRKNSAHFPFPYWNCLVTGPALFVATNGSELRDLSEASFREVLTYWMPYKTNVKGRTLGMVESEVANAESDEDLSDPDDDLYDDDSAGDGETAEDDDPDTDEDPDMANTEEGQTAEDVSEDEDLEEDLEDPDEDLEDDDENEDDETDASSMA